MVKKKYEKIIILGLSRSGNTSIAEFLRKTVYNKIVSVNTYITKKESLNDLLNNFDVLYHWNLKHIPFDLLKYMSNHPRYKNILFILNTRGLYIWLISFLCHLFRYTNVVNPANIVKTDCYEIKDIHSLNENIVNGLIKKRNNLFTWVSTLFKDKKNLIICDISNPNFLKFIGKKININFFEDFNIHLCKRKSCRRKKDVKILVKNEIKNLEEFKYTRLTTKSDINLLLLQFENNIIFD